MDGENLLGSFLLKKKKSVIFKQLKKNFFLP